MKILKTPKFEFQNKKFLRYSNRYTLTYMVNLNLISKTYSKKQDKGVCNNGKNE